MLSTTSPASAASAARSVPGAAERETEVECLGTGAALGAPHLIGRLAGELARPAAPAGRPPQAAGALLGPAWSPASLAASSSSARAPLAGSRRAARAAASAVARRRRPMVGSSRASSTSPPLRRATARPPGSRRSGARARPPARAGELDGDSARGSSREQLRLRADQDQVREGRRLLQGLQQRVLALVAQGLGLLDHEDPALPSTGRRLAARITDSRTSSTRCWAPAGAARRGRGVARIEQRAAAGLFGVGAPAAGTRPRRPAPRPPCRSPAARGRGTRGRARRQRRRQRHPARGWCRSPRPAARELSAAPLPSRPHPAPRRAPIRVDLAPLRASLDHPDALGVRPAPPRSPRRPALQLEPLAPRSGRPAARPARRPIGGRCHSSRVRSGQTPPVADVAGSSTRSTPSPRAHPW